MNESIIEFQGQDGYPVLVNCRYVAFCTPGMVQGANGSGPRQVAVGICAIAMANGQVLAVKCTMEELYRKLKGGMAILRDEA